MSKWLTDLLPEISRDIPVASFHHREGCFSESPGAARCSYVMGVLPENSLRDGTEKVCAGITNQVGMRGYKTKRARKSP
jgi:hypothetical protein